MADIDIGQITEALNDKLDRNLRNVDTTEKADTIIDYQEPTAENHYMWYRKYASGWIEQGGVTGTNTGGSLITLPFRMADINYSIMATILNVSYDQTTGGYDRTPGPTNVTTVVFWLEQPANVKYCARWQVSGMAA